WNYPKEERTNITTDLSVAYRGLEGSLKLDGFNNLKKLICYENRITSLDCSDCSSLEEIHCEDNLFINIKLTPSLRRVDVRNNSLTSLNFLNDLDSENLEWLNIHSNNFSESDLTPFSRFINLRELMLSNLEEEKIQQGIYNRFTGSLEPLKNLTRLNTLAIHNTDIGSGLEYLPDSIQYFYFSDAKQERKAGNIANSEKIKIVRQQTEQLETQPAITPSSSKKSKKVKQKEKLTVTQEQIQQLQAELEAKKSKNVNLEKEHSFYKNQEIEKSSFVRKQLKRAEDNLKKKLGEEELKLILEKQAEINDLENQLNNLQIQEQILTNLSDQIPELENQPNRSNNIGSLTYFGLLKKRFAHSSNGYLCPYHSSQIEDMLRRQRQDRNRPQDEYEQFPGCIFGKRNKKTKESKKYDEEIEELEKDLKETDRDEIADLSSDKKRLCCEYQKNIEEKERILKEKNNYQQSLGDSSSQSDKGNNNNSNNDRSIGKQRKRNIKRACKIESTEKRFTNLSFGTVWEENSLPTKQRRHPHQKPKELIKALIGATTNEGDLVVDPCAGSFIVLE
ncbi:5073_t:CDS:2, partial [Racocetra persica]